MTGTLCGLNTTLSAFNVNQTNIVTEEDVSVTRFRFQDIC